MFLKVAGSPIIETFRRLEQLTVSVVRILDKRYRLEEFVVTCFVTRFHDGPCLIRSAESLVRDCMAYAINNGPGLDTL